MSDFCFLGNYSFSLGLASLLLFFFFFFIFLFLAVLGLRCCARAFSSCSERGLLFVAVHGLLIVVASLVAEHGSRCAGFNSCGMWALERRLSSCGARSLPTSKEGLLRDALLANSIQSRANLHFLKSWLFLLLLCSPPACIGSCCPDLALPQPWWFLPYKIQSL